MTPRSPDRKSFEPQLSLATRFKLFVILMAYTLSACAQNVEANPAIIPDSSQGDGRATENSDQTIDNSLSLTPGAPATQTAENTAVESGRVTEFEQVLSDRVPVDFDGDKVFWYELGNSKIEQSVGSDSPFTAIAGLELKNKDDGSLIRRAIVSSSLTQFAVATELNQGEWVVETPVFPGKYIQIQGLDGKWEARGYFSGGNPVAGDAYQVDADGKYTGEIAYCNYTIGTCNVIDTNSTGSNGGYITSLIPKFESEQRAILDVLEGLGVNTSEYNYAFNTETKELGVYLDKDAFLSMQGVFKLTLADGSVVKLPISEVKYDDENGFSYPGYTQDTDGNWIEVAKSPAETWAAENGGQFDAEKNVAWDPSTGLVMWAMDAKGEWVNYPDGNVPIPPGPGYESEPPLKVPYYYSFNEAMAAITDELPWGEIPNVYRASQEAILKKNNNTYWKPIINNGQWLLHPLGRVDLHDVDDPSLNAQIFISQMQLPSGNIGMRVVFESSATKYYFTDLLVLGDAIEIFGELQRIDSCVEKNIKADNLAEMCKSEIVEVRAPVK